MRILMVYYSRTGTVRALAEQLAEMLGADIEEIVDTRRRTGPLGLLSAALDAVLRRPSRIGEPRRDPAGYDLVVVGTPVWGWAMSCPVRAYLMSQRDSLPEVGFFAVARAVAAGRAVRHMGRLCGKQPRASLALGRCTTRLARRAERIAAFVAALQPRP